MLQEISDHGIVYNRTETCTPHHHVLKTRILLASATGVYSSPLRPSVSGARHVRRRVPSGSCLQLLMVQWITTKFRDLDSQGSLPSRQMWVSSAPNLLLSEGLSGPSGPWSSTRLKYVKRGHDTAGRRWISGGDGSSCSKTAKSSISTQLEFRSIGVRSFRVR